MTITSSDGDLRKLIFEKLHTEIQDDIFDQGDQDVGGIEEVGFAWKTNSQVLNELSFSDLRFKPEQIKEDGDWIVYADRKFDGQAGKVVIRSKFFIETGFLQELKQIEFEIDGRPGDFLGSNVWITTQSVPIQRSRLL